MENKIIYPIIIIILSIIFIYGIINYKCNQKLNNTIENFKNDYLEKNNFGLNLVNNNKIISDIANGFWSSNVSDLDSSSYSVKENSIITIVCNYVSDPISISGTVTYPFKDSSGTYTLKNYSIISLLNNNIVAKDNDNPNNVIYIYISGVYENKNNINPGYSSTTSPKTQMAIISEYTSSTLVNKYVSYKIYKNGVNYNVSGEVFRILLSNDIYINSPPPVYDLPTYNSITSTSKDFSNYLSFDYIGHVLSDTTTTALVNYIKTNYLNTFKFRVKRAYLSPTDSNKIETKMSDIISLTSVVNSTNELPMNLRIKKYNEYSNKSYIPYSTNIYFYRLYSITPNYSFVGNNIKINPNNLGITNDINHDIFNQDIYYSNISGVTKTNTYQYNLVLLKTISATDVQFNNDITVLFSELFNMNNIQCSSSTSCTP
jgi:hypothetical protein